MSASRSSWPSSFHAEDDRLDFAPPAQPGMVRAVVLAVLAHLLLLLALTWGIRWNRDAEDIAAEAELWASVPQQAAPREVPQPPPPPPQPVLREQPRPEPVQRDAQIALEREKKRKAEEERERRELAERERQKNLEAQRKADEQKKEQQAKAAADKKKQAEERQRRERAEQERLAKTREDNLKRLQAMAGGGSPQGEQGGGGRSASAAWGARVVARIRPNIVFTDDVRGSIQTEVEIRLSPDGTITSRRITKSSGSKAWDDAVLRALDKTEVLPRDTDGTVPRFGTLVFSPRDF